VDTDFAEVSIERLQVLYAAGTCTPLEVTQWHLDRIEKFNPTYNAFTELFAEEALECARRLEGEFRRSGGRNGALWGVPIVVKANTCVAGRVTSVGWWGYACDGYELRARANARVVDQALDAGAIILGQTNMSELGIGNTCVSSVAGRTGNAYDPKFSPGGSSGGAATAVAASFSVAGIGTDAGNSIRNPASNLSLVGMVPTRGLTSLDGIHADLLRERAGTLTRTVADAATFLDVLKVSRSESFRSRLALGALRGKRYGVPAFILQRDTASPYSGTSPATRAAFMRSVRALEEAGATVVFSPDILRRSFDALANKIEWARYFRHGINTFLAAYSTASYRSTTEFEQTLGINYPPEGIGGEDSGHLLDSDPEAQRLYFEPRDQALALFREALREHVLDGFVYPALQVPPTNEAAPLHKGFPSDGPYSASNWVNKLGIPAVVVPAGFYGNGLPYGLEIAGDSGSDADLLCAAYDFEQCTHERRAPELRAPSQNPQACTLRTFAGTPTSQ
jgi:aspartyl-tRNA(Asn)/glutamyl-tRNA(Gln) amidotransferase subunit A